MVQKKDRERWPTSTHGFAVYPSSDEVPRVLLIGEVMGFVA
jgi:hypothetical protein